MKTNMQKLKGKIIEKGFSQETLAAAINMNKATLNRKLQNGEKFSIGEANTIVQVLSLSYQEAMDIFFYFDSRINANINKEERMV